MARPSNTDVRRAQIVAGLRRSMARNGYDGASVSEIARAARLAAGLVHYHFADKREILLALLEQLAGEAAERAARVLDRAGRDPLQRLEAYLDAFLARGDEADPEAVACWIAIAAEAIRDARVRAAFEAALTRMAGDLERLVAEALLRGPRAAPDARAIASALLATVHGYFLVSATAPALVPAGSAAPLAVALARALTRPRSGRTQGGGRR